MSDEIDRVRQDIDRVHDRLDAFGLQLTAVAVSMGALQAEVHLRGQVTETQIKMHLEDHATKAKETRGFFSSALLKILAPILTAIGGYFMGGGKLP
jgi:phosphoketolase